jgi:hypothetical protein
MLQFGGDADQRQTAQGTQHPRGILNYNVTIRRLCRSAAHCIEYAHLIQWGQEQQGDEFDPDIEDHMKWVYEKALLRAEQYGIPVSPNPTVINFMA